MNLSDRAAVARLIEGEEPHTLDLLAAARVGRERHFGRDVVIHILSNAKAGRCSEDCGFCSQSIRFESGIAAHPVKDAATLLGEAREAARLGAGKFCIVTATRAATPDLIARIEPAIRAIKAAFPKLKLCGSFGLLDETGAARLKSAGLDRYNHNLETSEAFFPRLATTHAWRERFATVRRAREAGLEICSGGIVGLGESAADLADLLFALREVAADSIPINFFNPRPGTPLGDRPPLEPMQALRILAVTRLVHPRADVRAAGGREAVLGPLQPLALYAASSIFSNGYLTTGGQGIATDAAMIRAIGYRIAGC